MKPEKKINGITFFPVPQFSDASVAMGADLSAYFKRREIPKIPAKYENMAQSLFFNGGNLPKLHKDIDPSLANRAIRAWLISFAPAHEAKIGTVGYALWLWSNMEKSYAPRTEKGETWE